jgi:hypothetical protein
MEYIDVVKLDKEVFIAHSEEDMQEVKKLIELVNTLPINFRLGLESAGVGPIPKKVRQQIKNSSLVLPYITENSKNGIWVNQEIGCAFGLEKEILPVFESSSQLNAFVNNREGVRINRDDWEFTAYQLITRLRRVFEPLQNKLDAFADPLSIKMPDWGVILECSRHNCNRTVSLDLSDLTQKELWDMYESGEMVVKTCPACDTEYCFNPATLEVK